MAISHDLPPAKPPPSLATAQNILRPVAAPNLPGRWGSRSGAYSCGWIRRARQVAQIHSEKW